MYDYAIVGGGIVGLATGLMIGQRYPDARLAILEKESGWARHQSSHNSGVLHSGIYYPPGSLKALLCTRGNRSMAEFCQRHDIEHRVSGKLIVATQEREVPLLDVLLERGRRNGIEVAKLTPEQARELEPHVSCRGALRVRTTGTVDFGEVCEQYARLVAASGGHLRLNSRVDRITTTATGVVLHAASGDVCASFLINCGGLHSDRLARLAGADPGARIVPFRGEYFELVPNRRELIRGLVYPLPNPEFPFLGTHFTRMIDGRVHVGPNAVLGLKREGYRKTDIDLRDIAGVLAYPGFWRLARTHAREGAQELARSASKRLMVRSLQRMVPELGPDDLTPAPAGVRAQAVARDGSLIDDFLLVRGPRSLHVCNAPSPAATASLEIARTIVERLPAMAHLKPAALP